MAKKGESKSEKRLAASKVIPLLRKRYAWHIKAGPGPHGKQRSVALGFVLRDLIGIAKNAKEAKRILSKGLVMVDGRVEKSSRRPVGLFDLVSLLPEKKTFRVLLSKKGKIMLAEEKFAEREKLCKVIGKKAIAKNAVQLATNDGRTFNERKTEASVGDSLLVQLPEQKILKVLKQGPKKVALVVDGKHMGEVAKVKQVVLGTMSRPKLVELETKEGEFKTVESNIVIVGQDKPVIKVE